MFALTKLAYHACTAAERRWYDTVPENAAPVRLEKCCATVLDPGRATAAARDGACDAAAGNGHVDCLRAARSMGLPWDAGAMAAAAAAGRLECMRYMRDGGCPWDERTCHAAARAGRLECLAYAHARGCPWTVDTVRAAVAAGRAECAYYALDHACHTAPARSADAACWRCYTESLRSWLHG